MPCYPCCIPANSHFSRVAVTFVGNRIWNIVLDFACFYVVSLVLGKIFNWNNKFIFDELIVTL